MDSSGQPPTDTENGAALPRRGRPWLELEQELVALRAHDYPVEGSPFYAYWPVPPDAALHAARETLAMFGHVNTFAKDLIYSIGVIDERLRAIVAELLRAPPEARVTLTAGGTEGNFLAAKSARNRRRASGPSLAKRPRLVIPYTAHPSFDKAAHELDLEVVRVGCDDRWRVDVEAMAAAIDERTIMVVASVPSYGHGVADDVAAVGRLVRDTGIWFHVDAAVGGFLHPFMRQLGRDLPDADFQVPEVTSMTADLHKFGFALTGVSTFTLRNRADYEHQRFTFSAAGKSGWPVADFVRPGFLGSRPAAHIAAAWALMQTLGEDGYLRIAAEICDQGHRIAERVSGLPGLRMVGSTELGVVAIGVERSILLPALLEALKRRGRLIGRCENPPCLHFLLGPGFEVDPLLDDLERALEDVRSGTGGQTAVASIYGEE